MMNVAWTVSIRLHLKVDGHTRIFGGRRMIMHDKSRAEVMLDRGEHPTMPLNYCSLVWLAFKQLGGRIMLSLQFKFLALKGHISIARAMKDHIIRVTCLATCPFGLLDARTYFLYRDVFFLGFFSHSFLKAIQLLHILCTPSLLLCTLSLSSMILPLPLLSASSSEVLPS